MASKDRLETYRRKRDFTVTSEPSGAATGTRPPAAGRRFVVQRHRATRLHYDLRLEAAGVLLSWAVPKGPTLDPDVRRMAIHVEDHPLDYFDFEGVIPAGEYGGGDVIVWDWGTWELAEADDPIAAVDAGSLHFDLHGEKLAGRFALVRRGRPGDREQWLLIHKHDASAVAGWDAEHHPESVKSGRTNDEVRAAPAATWSGTASWAGPTPEEVAALDALPAAGGRWVLGEHELELTDLAEVRIPARRPHPAITTRDVIRHYAQMAPALLPYLHDRPVVAGDPETTAVLDTPAALAQAANRGAIELRPRTSTAEHPQRPTWALIAIAPGRSSTFDDVVALTRLHRTALDHLGVAGCPKVDGSRGLEIWIPVAARYGFDETRAWVERLAEIIGATVPELVSSMSLDATHNAIDQPLVAPFSIRARPGAPVSVPITWDELDDPDLRADRWTIADIDERLRRQGDPLAPLIGKQQQLPPL